MRWGGKWANEIARNTPISWRRGKILYCSLPDICSLISYTYMYVCIHMYMYKYRHTYTLVCIFIFMYSYIYTYCIHIYIYMYVHICIYTCVHSMYIYVWHIFIVYVGADRQTERIKPDTQLHIGNPRTQTYANTDADAHTHTYTHTPNTIRPNQIEHLIRGGFVLILYVCSWCALCPVDRKGPVSHIGRLTIWFDYCSSLFLFLMSLVRGSPS